MPYAVGAACIRDPLEATAAACAGVQGVTTSGVVSCEAASLSGHVMNYTLAIEGSSRITRPASMTLQDCTPVDLAEFGPVVAAWFLALVVILAARSVYTKVFNRESY